MSKTHDIRRVIAELPEWPYSEIARVRRYLEEGSGHIAHETHLAIQADPPPGDLPASHADALLAKLGIKPRH